MKIKYIGYQEKENLKNNADYLHNNLFDALVINKKYIVYALSEYYNCTWFCICDELYTYHPMWIPHYFFEVVDNRISRYWVFSFKQDIDKNRFFFSVPEWALQLDFYDRLTDGETYEVQTFQAYKKLMDLEFPDDSVDQTAQPIDKEWIMCPICLDAWFSEDTKDALISCPKCSQIFNNPRYKNEYPHLINKIQKLME